MYIRLSGLRVEASDVYFMELLCLFSFFFFFNDTATTEIYTLSLHDALPICAKWKHEVDLACGDALELNAERAHRGLFGERSEEHTSELQSPCNLVCRLLLEKKKKNNIIMTKPSHDVVPAALSL